MSGEQIDMFDKRADDIEPYFYVNDVSIFPRRAKYFQWIKANPILGYLELALETDTKKVKLGNGVNKYEDLKYCESLNDVFFGG